MQSRCCVYRIGVYWVHHIVGERIITRFYRTGGRLLRCSGGGGGGGWGGGGEYIRMAIPRVGGDNLGSMRGSAAGRWVYRLRKKLWLYISIKILLEGTVSRDFRPQVYLLKRLYLGPACMNRLKRTHFFREYLSENETFNETVIACSVFIYPGRVFGKKSVKNLVALYL